MIFCAAACVAWITIGNRKNRSLGNLTQILLELGLFTLGRLVIYQKSSNLRLAMRLPSGTTQCFADHLLLIWPVTRSVCWA